MPYTGTITVGSVGITENNGTSDILMFPNPANTNFKISYIPPTLEKIKLAMYNQLGQNIMPIVDQEIVSGIINKTIDVTSFSAGVYYIKLESESTVLTKRIVIQK